VCPEWKAQQKVLWAEAQEETGRWKSRWRNRDLLADGRCSQAVLDFLYNVGRLVPAEGDAGDEVSEWERSSAGSGKKSGGRRRRSRVPRGNSLVAREELPLFLPIPSSQRGLGGGRASVVSFSCHLTLIGHFSGVVRWCASYLLGRPGRRAKGSLQRAATAWTADGKNG